MNLQSAAISKYSLSYFRQSFAIPGWPRWHPIRMLPRIDAAKLTLTRQPFDSAEYLYELKHDGFRALAYIAEGRCELISRRHNSYKSFGPLRDSLATLP